MLSGSSLFVFLCNRHSKAGLCRKLFSVNRIYRSLGLQSPKMGSRNMMLESSRTTFDAISRPAGRQFSRCFSWTASRDTKHRPVKFNYTSPELHETLKTIRERIIIPSYLSEDQKKKVYDYRYQKELEIDPIVVDVDGEEFKFGYINPKSDVPNTKKLVHQAVEHMRTKSDFSNVAPLLEGLKQAKRAVDWKILPKIVRKAGKADAIGRIVDAAGWVERTNLRLIHSETVNTLLCYIQQKALDSEWDKEETLKALKQANKVIEVMEERKENHPDGLSWSQGMTLRKMPLYRDPQVLAARLHLAAVLAVKHYDGKDADGLVTKYAQEVVALWPEDVGLLGLHAERAYQTQPDMGYLVRKEGIKFAWFAAPILHGFKLAAMVVKPELKQTLLARAEKLEAEIKQTKPQFESVEIYQKLFDANIGPTAEPEPAKEELQDSV